jgi:hypothetical protein
MQKKGDVLQTANKKRNNSLQGISGLGCAQAKRRSCRRGYPLHIPSGLELRQIGFLEQTYRKQRCRSAMPTSDPHDAPGMTLLVSHGSRRAGSTDEKKPSASQADVFGGKFLLEWLVEVTLSEIPIPSPIKKN